MQIPILDKYDILVNDFANKTLPIYNCTFFKGDNEFKDTIEMILSVCQAIDSGELKISGLLDQETIEQIKQISSIITDTVKANEVINYFFKAKVDFKQLSPLLTKITEIIGKINYTETIVSDINNLISIINQKGNDITIKEILTPFHLGEFYSSAIQAANLIGKSTNETTIKEVVEIIKLPYISLSQTIKNFAELKVPSFYNIANCIVTVELSSRKTLEANTINPLLALAKSIQELSQNNNATIKEICAKAGIETTVVTDPFTTIDQEILSPSAINFIRKTGIYRSTDQETIEFLKSLGTLTEAAKEGKVNVKVVEETSESFSNIYNHPAEKKKVNVGLIIGLVIGGIAILAIIGFFVYKCMSGSENEEDQAKV